MPTDGPARDAAEIMAPENRGSVGSASRGAGMRSRSRLTQGPPARGGQIPTTQSRLSWARTLRPAARRECPAHREPYSVLAAQAGGCSPEIPRSGVRYRHGETEYGTRRRGGVARRVSTEEGRNAPAAPGAGQGDPWFIPEDDVSAPPEPIGSRYSVPHLEVAA